MKKIILFSILLTIFFSININLSETNSNNYSLNNNVNQLKDQESRLILKTKSETKIYSNNNEKKVLKAYSDELPSIYNFSNEPNYQTSVKDQIISGPCWAFATLGAMESFLLKKNGINSNFSERNLINNHGYLWKYSEGGNRDLAIGYLTRWAGPINEEDDLNYEPVSSLTKGYLKDKVKYHIQDIYFIPDNDIINIKKAIREYGAVFSTMLWSDNYLNSYTNAYNASVSGEANHAITLVGWDDNYSKNNFLTKPSGDGAFLVKASNGSSYYNNGYFYISYYDNFVGKENFVFTNIESNDNYNYKYEYDTLGWTGNAGFGYNSETAWFSNVFEANQGNSEVLKAVSFYTNMPNSSYEIYVNTTFTNYSKPNLTKIGQGVMENPGYHTVKLDKEINLNKNYKFSVAIKITSPGSIWPIALEYRSSNYSPAVVSRSGESFVSLNGEYWTDINTMSSSCNVCLKAFTSEKNESTNLNVNTDNRNIDSKTTDTRTIENKNSKFEKQNLKRINANFLSSKINIGQSIELKVKAISYDGSEKIIPFEDIKYKIINPKHIKIDNGKVTGVSKGYTSIIMEYNGKKTLMFIEIR